MDSFLWSFFNFLCTLVLRLQNLGLRVMPSDKYNNIYFYKNTTQKIPSFASIWNFVGISDSYDALAVSRWLFVFFWISSYCTEENEKLLHGLFFSFNHDNVRIILNPIQNGHFRGCSRMEGEQKGPLSLKSVTRMPQWWNLVQLYLS